MQTAVKMATTTTATSWLPSERGVLQRSRDVVRAKGRRDSPAAVVLDGPPLRQHIHSPPHCPTPVARAATPVARAVARGRLSSCTVGVRPLGGGWCREVVGVVRTQAEPLTRG